MTSTLQQIRTRAVSWSAIVKSTVLKVCRTGSNHSCREGSTQDGSKEESITSEKKDNVQMCVDRNKRKFPYDHGQRRSFKKTLIIRKERLCHSVVEGSKLRNSILSPLMSSNSDSEVEL